MTNIELLVFEVGNYELAIPLALVEEVVPASRVTPIPQTPPFLLGLAAVRGRVMAVIDTSARYGLGPSLTAHFLVCSVRGNMTAITIDRPLLAGNLCVRSMESVEKFERIGSMKLDKKFIKAGYELLDVKDGEAPRSTGRYFFEIHADLFVSDEMASMVGAA